MIFQMAEAPTMLMAIGMKIRDLLSFSFRGLSRSARTATTRPRATDIVGTTIIQSRVLMRTCWKLLDPRRFV